MFVVVQFFLSQEVTGKDTALTRLNAQIAQLTELLSLEKTGKLSRSRSRLAQLRVEPRRQPKASATAIKGLYDGLGSGASAAQGKVNELTGQARRREADDAARAGAGRGAQPADRRAAPPACALEQALDVSEKKDKEAQSRIADLGQRLNLALAQRVQELSRYRSDFFGRLRTILGNRPDIRIVGDRFVFQSEVFFDTGQAVLKPEGRAELDKLGDRAARTREADPAGHRLGAARRRPYRRAPDQRPAVQAQLGASAARAISVVQYLISKGMPPQRLVAAGFGEFQPIDAGSTEEAFSRNRRIELKLTER